MNSIVYVGMDVHKESHTICCYSFDKDEVMYKQKMSADYKLILKYIEQLRIRFADDTEFVCGYEAGCLGYSLYHQLTDHGVKCIILAPSTMAITNTSRVISMLYVGTDDRSYRITGTIFSRYRKGCQSTAYGRRALDNICRIS